MRQKNKKQQNKKRRVTRDDLIREFQLEHARSEYCFDRMYKILQFTFAAIIAIAIFAFNKQIVQDYTKLFMLSYVLPAVSYVFGLMFLHNAYSLSVCGKRAITIRKEIYCDLKENESKSKYSLNNVLYNYVSADRKIAFVAYGSITAFYLLLPLFSILICFMDSCDEKYAYLLWISFAILILYYVFMMVMIVGIACNFRIKDSSV